jgi:hypothetical protein
VKGDDFIMPEEEEMKQKQAVDTSVSTAETWQAKTARLLVDYVQACMALDEHLADQPEWRRWLSQLTL